MVEIKTLKELSNKQEITEQEQRLVIMFYIYYNTGITVKEVITAPMGSVELFNKNLEIAKMYFKSFEI